MSRTNIDIPDDLVQRAMQMYALETKRDAVILALKQLVGGDPMTREELLAMEGSGFDLDLDELRPGWEPPEL